jgi:hypothetical protein
VSMESWKFIFDWMAVILVFLTFVAGTGALWTGNILNRRQGERLKKFDSDLTEAKLGLATQQERAANAEASIALAEQHSAEANAKAEGFRLDIAKSNEAAAQAQAQVAGAMAEAAKANLELERIRTPRSLTNVLGLTDSLMAFKGTEYTVIGCFQDQESIDLLTQLDKALAATGWTRKLPPQNSFGDLRLNISKDFAVPTTTRSGIYVGAQSSIAGSVGIRLEDMFTFPSCHMVQAVMHCR